MVQNGIPQNQDKFQFGNKTVEWAGFLIGEKSVKPLKKHTEAIRSLPTTFNITDLRSFMALQQVAYCFATLPATALLIHLLKLSEPWDWSEVTRPFPRQRRSLPTKLWKGWYCSNLSYQQDSFRTGVVREWDIFLAKNIAAVQTRLISTVVMKHGKSAVSVAGSARTQSKLTNQQMENSQRWWMPWKRQPTLLWAAAT